MEKKPTVRDKRLIFRLTRDELAEIAAAAAKDERPIGQFARLTLLRAIRAQAKKAKS